MKTRNYFLASLLILAVSSCQSLFDEDSSRVVRFSVSVKNDRTKVHYSGDVNKDGRERIEWDKDPVDIYMFWDAFGYVDPDHDWRTYIVEHQGHGENDYIDRGTLHTEGADELKWKGDATQGDVIKHYFYGVYPAGAGRNLNRDKDGNASVSFTLPANANNMNYAYMAAGGQKDPIVTAESYDKAVELDFYPMVTTLYVTLNNGTQKSGPIELRLAPSSKNTSNPLYGSYSARYDQLGKMFVTVDTAEESVGENQVSSISVNVAAKDTVSIPFFIRPRKYAEKDVTLTIGNESHDLNVAFAPCHKYNITITIEENGTVNPPVIEDDALAQMILAYMRAFNGGEKFYEQFKEFVDKSFKDYSEFLNFWNDFVNDTDISTVKGAAGRLKSLLGDRYAGFMAALGEIEDFTMKTYGVSSESIVLGEEFNAVFKKIKSIQLFSNNLKEIKIEKSTTLESFETTRDSNNKDLVFTVENSPSFKRFNFPADGTTLSKIVLRNTPLFEKGFIYNQNQSNFTIELEGCSAGVQSATIQIGNQNLRQTAKREKGDSKNVVVECGRWDIISWDPFIYGEWHATYRETVN